MSGELLCGAWGLLVSTLGSGHERQDWRMDLKQMPESRQHRGHEVDVPLQPNPIAFQHAKSRIRAFDWCGGAVVEAPLPVIALKP